MSHFTVLVVAKDDKDLDEKLFPYYEYGCSRELDDELRRRGLLEFTSVEDEYRESYETESSQWIRKPDGEMVSKYDNEAQALLADGAELVDIPHKERYPDFETFMEDWVGYESNDDGEYGYWENPNAKWDWYSVGGRWSGLLRLKSNGNRLLLRGNTEVAGLNRNEVDFLVKLYKEKNGKFEEVIAKYDGKSDEIRNAVEQIANGPEEGGFVRPDGAENGVSGVVGMANSDPEHADTAFAKDVDWEWMKNERLDRHMKGYYTYQEYLQRLRDEEWSNVHEDAHWKAKEVWEEEDERSKYARAAYSSLDDFILSLAVDIAMRKDGIFTLNTFEESADLFYKSEDEYRALFKDDALTYAFVDQSGEWYQRGQMGWWGLSDESQGTDDYDEAFWMLIDSLPGDMRVYVVDCHI